MLPFLGEAAEAVLNKTRGGYCSQVRVRPLELARFFDAGRTKRSRDWAV